MEVYTTIFMIFVSHVLSCFSQTSSRQRGRRYTSEEKIRRIPIVYFHNQDDVYDENEAETAVGYIMPYLEPYTKRLPVEEPITMPFVEGETFTELNKDVIRFENNLKSEGGGTSVRKKKSWLSRVRKWSRKKSTRSNLKSSTDPLVNSDKRKKSGSVTVKSFENIRFEKPWLDFCLKQTIESLYSDPTSERPLELSANPIRVEKRNSEFPPPSPNYPLKISKIIKSPRLFHSSMGKNGVFNDVKNNFGGSTLYDRINIYKKIPPFDQNMLRNEGMLSHKRLASGSTNERNQAGQRKKRGFFTEEGEGILPLSSNKYKKQTKDLKRQKRSNGYYRLKTYHLKSSKGDKNNFMKRNAEESLKKLLPFGLRGTTCKSVPHTCKEPCFYNLSSLIVARTVIPPGYFKKNRPQLVIYCPNNSSPSGECISLSIPTSATIKKTTCGTTKKPCVTTKKPCPTTTKPCPTTTKPCPTTTKPCTTTKKPCPTTTKPCTTTTKPCTTTKKPCTTTKKPCPTTTKPCPTTKKPSTTTKKPCTTTTKPCPTTKKPSTTTKKPSTTTKKPCTTTTKPCSPAAPPRPSTKPCDVFKIVPTDSSLYKIVMQFNDVTTTSSPPTSSKDRLVIQLFVKNKDDLNEPVALNFDPDLEEFSEQFKNYVILKGEEALEGKGIKKKTSNKSPYNPADATDVYKKPWLSTCSNKIPCSKKTKITTKCTKKDVTALKCSTPCDNVKKSTVSASASPGSRATNKVTTPAGITVSKNTPFVVYHNASKNDVLTLLEGDKRDNKSIMVLVRVPFSVAKDYDEKGFINFVLPLNSSTIPKYVKPRSIFNQLIPSIMRKKTIPPFNHADKPWEIPWKPKEERFNLFTKSKPNNCEGARKLYRLKPLEPNPMNDAVKRISDFCPACGRKNNLEADTCNNSKISKIVMAENSQASGDTTDVGPQTHANLAEEDCDGNCISYLLQFPKHDLVDKSPPPISFHPTRKGFKLIEKFGPPPKYYIEVPESMGESIKKAIHVTRVSTNNPGVELKERRLVTPERILLKPLSRKKPIVLYLQPFEVNGHKVYLPVPGSDQAKKSKARFKVEDEDVNDYLEITDNIGIQSHAFAEFMNKNDSNLPFALIPAYLTFHPKNKFNYDLNVLNAGYATTECTQADDEDEPEEEIYSKRINKENPTSPSLKDVPIEEKWLSLSRQIENSLYSPLASIKLIAAKKKVTPIRRRPTIPPHKPSAENKAYIIVMKDEGKMSPLKGINVPKIGKNKFVPINPKEFTIIEYRKEATATP